MVCVNIDIMKTFFTLGYMSEYLPVGIAFGVIIGVYTFFRLRSFLRSFGKDPKAKNMRILRLAAALVPLAFCANIWATSNVLALYIFFAGALADIIALIIRLAGKKRLGRFYLRGGLALLLFLLMFAHAVYTMNHIVETDYTVTSDKVERPYRLLYIADTHYGSIQSPKRLEEAIPEMNALNADFIILGGDIVEERTSKEELEECFATLGTLTSAYGTFYVYGNHDRQPYTVDLPGGVRTYTDEELDNAIEKNGITILSDETALIDDTILIVGREDLGWYDNPRATVPELLAASPDAPFLLMSDHQPVECEENAALGFDMSISGHTHGGQMWPVPLLYNAMGILNYGEYHFDQMTHITSSGFTGWGWPVRNAYYCEYVVVDILPAS